MNSNLRKINTVVPLLIIGKEKSRKFYTECVAPGRMVIYTCSDTCFIIPDTKFIRKLKKANVSVFKP